MAQSLGLVFDLLMGKDSASPGFLKFSSAAEKASASAIRAQKDITTAQARLGTVGAKLTKSLTLPLAGLGAVAVAEAAKYNRGLATIANATDQTNKQMKSASSGLLKIASSTGASLSQLTDGLYTVEKGGLRGSTALNTVKAAAQGAAAEGADLGTVTNALTSIMASYGSKIGTPVQAMDQLVRGSGLAKTSLQDFSGSLSTVVPLAAKAGISFAQVAGVVDTLTQHGTSAQEATQELANLIRNLQAPSQVAQKAMQQVGLSVTDLTSHLGSRGLIGTLSKVEDAVSSHLGKSGLVAVDVFKKSASASADLQTMIKSMPTDLAKVSQQLLTGAVSIKDYQAGAKALGGQAGASALQFLSLFKSSKGFNDLLKSGQPGVRTAAAELKDLLGGSTALNAALQLGGHSAKYFADASASVAKAAQGAGADVLGWGRTQALFSTKVAMAKENLQVLAVELGTALLPAVSKIADAVGKAAHSFDGLSHTQKEVLGWGLGVAAAIGPVLTIGSRLSAVGSGVATATSFIASRFATLAGATQTQAATIGVAAGRIGTALGAAGLGVAVGELTKNSDNTKKAVGVLGSALAGAAIGSSGGPWGAALGAAAGGIGALATSYLHLGGSASKGGEAARAALASQNQAAGQLEQSLEGVASAYGAAYKQQLAQSLTKTNVGGQNFNILGIAKTAGINPQDIISQAVGTGTPRQLDAITKALIAANVAGKISEPQWDAVSTAIGLVGKSAATAEKNIELQAQATGQALVPANQLGTSLGKLRAAFSGTGTAINNQSAAGLRNQEILRENVTALNTAASSELAHGTSVAKVARTYGAQISALETNATKLGLNKTQVDGLIQQYASLPKSVVTRLEQKGISGISPLLLALLGLYRKVPSSKNTNVGVHDHASGPLASIRSAIGSLPTSKTVTVYSRVVSTATGAPSGLHSVGGTVPSGIIIGAPKKATGGTVRGPGTGTSDSVPILASNGEEIINARQSARHRGLLKAINAGIGGFATGGTVGYKPAKSYTGPDGQKYASSRAADNAFTRAIAALTKELPKFTTALAGTADQLKSAETTLINDVKAVGASSKVLAQVQKDFGRLNKLATARDSLQARLGTPDNTKQTAYQNLADAMSKFNDEASTVASAITSGFSLQTAGTIDTSSAASQAAAARLAANGFGLPGDDTLANGGFSLTQALGSLQQQIADSSQFAAQLAQLNKSGFTKTAAGKSIFQQIAELGPSQGEDELSAILGGTSAQRSALLSGTSKLTSLGAATGRAVATVEDGEQVKAAQATVELLKQQIANDKAEMAKQTKAIVAAIHAIGGDVGHALDGVARSAHMRARGTPSGKRT